MDPQLSGDRITFHPVRPRSNPYRLLLLVFLILGALWLLLRIERGQVKPILSATPIPTRTGLSYVQEGQAHFAAGDLNAAIAAYQDALNLDADNAELWAELARVQAYSSVLSGTDKASLNRQEEALESIDQAVALNPDSSSVHAIRAMVLDWKATNPLTSESDRQALLNDAENEAVRALQLDPQNALALAYYAEVLLDQQKWLQAQEYIEDAFSRNPDSVDVRRVRALVLESLGQYRDSIAEYEAAAKINPNLTFLYISIGYTYRSLQVYDKALEFFAEAVSINEQLGIEDPAPYIGIAKTYTQQGEFFIAARNGEKALSFDPTNADTYGQLGIIYVRSRNFEGALPVLKCSVVGCDALENEIGGVAVEGQPLTSRTLPYYLQYASVLAALSRPEQDFCPEALTLLDQIDSMFPDDPTTASVVQENRAICRLLP